MARRESKASRDYNRGMEDMKRQMEAQIREMEERLRTAAKIMVLKERESWKSERQQLQDEKRTLQRKLSVTGEANRALESDLNSAKEMIGRAEEEISSLNLQFSALKERYDTSRLILWRELKKERLKSEEEKKERDELTISLLSLQAQKEDAKRIGASAEEKVSKLEGLLIEKDKEVSKAIERRRARTKAHVDTLALLTKTESALKESKFKYDALEEKFQKQLSEKESYQKELSQREQNWIKQLSEKESCQKELTEKAKRSGEELSTLSDSWEKRAQQWEIEQRELEEKLQAKEKSWILEEAKRKELIRRLTKEIFQLQETIMEKNQKKSFFSWSYNK